MIGYFAKHPTASNLLMLLILILGVSALPNIKRETFPEFANRKLQVSVIYPGASTSDVETGICVPLEEAIDGLAQIDTLSCESREGQGKLTVELEEGGNIARLLSDVKTEVDAIDNFPQQAESPLIKEIGRNDPLITLAISADTADFHLKQYAESVKDQLQKLPDISLIELQGFSDQQLSVRLNLPLLRQYGLSIEQVAQRIKRQNVKLPSGNLETQGKTLLIRVDQQKVTAVSLATTIISNTPQGGVLRLSDIAQVTERFEKDEVSVFIGGKRTALLKINKTKSQDALVLVDQVKQFVNQLEKQAPKRIDLTLTQDTAKIVEDRLNMLLGNAWQGILLVFAVMWLFFGWRYSFWVAMGLPVSFMGAFWLMSLMGVSINMISMVALLMSIGILMDDAIVIAESIAHQLEKGKSALQGAIDGVLLVGPGVFSSFLTTASVFIGLLWLSGDIGAVLQVFPQVLLATVAVSLIEAFFILPCHLYHSLLMHPQTAEETVKQPKIKRWFNQTFENFRHKQLVNLVERLTQHRYLASGAAFALFFMTISLLAGGAIKFKAFPSLEGDILEMRLLMPQGTPLDQTKKIVQRSVKQLELINQDLTLLQPELNGQPQSLIKSITVEYNQNGDAFEKGTHIATVRADILTAETRNSSIYTVKDRWRDSVGEVAGAIQLAFKEPTLGPSGRPIEIQLHSENLQQLSEAAWEIRQQLISYQGVVDVLDDLRPGKPEWKIELLPSASALGVDGLLIANQLRSGYFGITADEFQRGSQTLKVDVQLSDRDKSSLQQLQNFPITLNNGQQIPLASLTNITPDRGYARINRVNGQRTVTLIGDIDTRYANTQQIIAEVEKTTILPLLEKYPNLSFSYQGELKQGNTTGKSIMQKFLMGLIGVFIILSFQFRSYAEPIIVMLAIPLALIGSLWGHLLFGYDFTMPSMLGFVSLAGIVVNNSILLVTYIKVHIADGMSLHQSAVQAAHSRFRAIFITTATTIAGTLPILLETSLQAQIVQPLVVSLIFGLASSSILVVLILPCFYMILEDFGLVELKTS
ncbi:efflux RND transporter permease subunit [Pelagibaculum spongiae]|uniref:AcrB/AcrD/AcrF family protein n=1 Tax=Pelagibaculum spongiae TaxID=2080658 RepID=A0A2V1GXB7_9GAMM|nr:efflux RND transporter permease subunit [Pelagibaculum spongiae]PVZ71821.1 AcrB/AcrD/AcrF family protein [Pelagibaculum spongiae]